MPVTRIEISFEFFPPRTPEAVDRLKVTRERLAALGPSFFSVTFGAGGSTRDLTLETVLGVRQATGIECAPHISCLGSPLAELHAVIDSYLDHHGIRRVVALRGDMPSGLTGHGALRYASELVALIRQRAGNRVRIEVAAYPEFHPQAQSAAADLRHFREKVQAGANSAITQYFYNPDAYFRFLDSCASLGIDIPIVPGIMPITNFTQLMRFSEACGAEVPRWIVARLRDFGDDRAAIRAFGIDVVTALCARLIEQGVPGLHFYTMNQYEAPEAILRQLGLGEAHERHGLTARAP